MTAPVTKEDFRLIGIRFPSEAIVAETDRLLPLARTDAVGLAAHEYTAADRTILEGFHKDLVAERAEQRILRGEKKGSRRNELGTIMDSKQLLRSGIDVGHSAVERIADKEGLSDEEKRRIVTSFAGQLDGLAGQIGLDSATLRTRLTSLAAILEAADLAPAADAAEARKTLVQKLKDAALRLPDAAQVKKALQESAKEDTAAMDVLDGRSYMNLKRLVRAGKNFHNAAGNHQRAAEYNLKAIHSAARRLRKPAPAPAPDPKTK